LGISREKSLFLDHVKSKFFIDKLCGIKATYPLNEGLVNKGEFFQYNCLTTCGLQPFLADKT
jgi:hypothetical protein